MKRNLLEEIEVGTKNAQVKKRIIHHYIVNGTTTITDLAKAIDLSVPTITKFIGDMCENGYINDYGKMETAGGRHPNLYGLNPEAGYFLGVDLQVEALVLGLMNFKGDVVKVKRIMPFSLKNDDDCIDLICEHINSFIDNADIDRNKVLYVNVNLPSRVNPKIGHSYGFFNYVEKPLNTVFSEKLNCAVSIDNDTRAMAYGEFMKGCVRDEKNIIYVNISWGLSISIVIDGNMYYGKSGFAGEFGHIPAFDNEVLCYCGKKGCLETEVSGAALHRNLVQAVNSGISSVIGKPGLKDKDVTLNEIIEATKNEDPLCIELVEEIGQKLGRHIAALINIFNPEMVVVGGTLSTTGDYLLQPMESAIRKYSLSLVNKDTKIERSQLQDNAGIIGACMFARSKAFEIE